MKTVKPQVCEICKKEFSQWRFWRVHIKGQNPVTCSDKCYRYYLHCRKYPYEGHYSLNMGLKSTHEDEIQARRGMI